MNQTFYLVDSNALVALRRERIQSDFFRSYCRVTDDVLREVSEHPDEALLSRRRYDLTPNVLEQVRDVMKSVAVGDTALALIHR